MNHEQYMQIALNLAHRGLGRTWPNPSVGCVIVKNGEIIARARTAIGGRPHAETIALKTAGKNAQGATIYVTLEPCSHRGKTPACAEEIIKYQPAAVIIGCLDPDPRTNGKGIKRLKNAGIKVTTGVLEKNCRRLNAGFFKIIEKGLPYVMVKAAISADGKYLPGKGTTRWLTGEQARNQVQLLRSQYDAILTGTGTVLADNPQLNCRLPGMEDLSPLKIIIGKRKIPPQANVNKGKKPLYFKDNLKTTLSKLAKQGITRVMVEAGPQLANSLLKAKLADEVIIFKSPKILAKQGKKFFTQNALKGFKQVEKNTIGADRKIVFRR